MAKKKKNARREQAAAAAAEVHEVLVQREEETTADDALDSALHGLDSVAQEASRYHAQAAEGATAVTERQRELLAAMAAPHWLALGGAVVQYGLQLLPLLDDLLQRVGLAVCTPALSSAESWEVAALLAVYYRAAAAPLVAQLAELLQRAEGRCLWDCDCLAGRAPRKLAALRDMLLGAGPYLPPALLQRLSLRLAVEVVEDGMREGSDCPVPADCAAAVVRLLAAALQVCRPAPPELFVAAAQSLRHLSAVYHRGAVSVAGSAPPLAEGRAVMTALVELRELLHTLRHPSVVAAYSAPQVVMEHAKRKVFVVEGAAAPPPEVEEALVAAKKVRVEEAPREDAQSTVVETVAPTVVPAPPTVSVSTAAPKPNTATVATTTVAKPVSPPPPPPMSATAAKQTTVASTAATTTASVAAAPPPPRPADSDSEDIPDINWED